MNEPQAAAAPAASSFAVRPTPGREGVIEGYASVFERLDGGHDIVLPGAFARTLAERPPSSIKLLWQHDPKQPVGIVEELREDARGLHVRARLLPELKRGREALALIEAGALDGLSIGYRTVKARHDASSGARLIEEIDLWEISLVTFPMQPAARIRALKAATPHQGIRAFERFLRDAGGFSRTEAKALAAHGFSALVRRDAEPSATSWAACLATLARFNESIEESLPS